THVLGVRPLSGSPATATLITTALEVGSHTISAVYSGDAGFTSSSSGIQPTKVQSVVVGGLTLPKAVAVDAQGDIFVADTGNNRVLEVKPDGSQAIIGSGLVAPSGVAVDGHGDVFVLTNHQVVEVK